jgi:tetratricopeptide (TPR) repeat protein
VGTLRYMSPEQALAQRAVIDHRTDVYSLGATLYELLTLRPVFEGSDRQELLRQIAFDEPKHPRKVNRAVPPELETVLLKALAKDPAERYATAQDLADDLRRFLEDKPIQARRPSIVQRARKWTRRQKGLVRTAAVLALLGLVVGGAFLWREQVQRAAVERAVQASLERADLLRQQERWDEALAVLTLAESQLAGRGLDALRERVQRQRRDVSMLLQLDKARLQAAAGSKETGFDWAGADQLYAEAFAGYGLDVACLDPAEAAARLRGSAITTHLIAGLDDWAFVRNHLRPDGGAWLRAVANRADDDPWRRRLREAVGNQDRAALEALAGNEGVQSQSPANVVLLARSLGQVHSQAVAEQLLRRAQEEHPADFWVNYQLARTVDEKRPSDAGQVARFCQAALALRPQSPVVYNQLGNALLQQGKLSEAVRAYRKGLKLQPDYALLHSNLGSALEHLGKLWEAMAACRRAIELRPDLAVAYSNLGSALVRLGRPVDAEAACRKAIALRPDLADAHTNLGVALFDQAKLTEAEAAFRRAIVLEPDNGAPHFNLGGVLRAQGRLPEAEAATRKAIALQPGFATAPYNLGHVVRDARQFDGTDR